MAARQKKTNFELESAISGLEVDLVGVASLKDCDNRLAEMAAKLLPSAQSVVIIGMEIFPEVIEHGIRGKKIADAEMKGLLESHYDYLNAKLDESAYEVAKALHKAGFKALPLAKGLPLNRRRLMGLFSLKHAAGAAGLGTIGRSSLLITPKYGPRVRLAGCLTEAVLKPTRSGKRHDCGDCHICIDACQAGALTLPPKGEPYSINKFACNSYRADGYCSECLRICPAGR